MLNSTKIEKIQVCMSFIVLVFFREYPAFEAATAPSSGITLPFPLHLGLPHCASCWWRAVGSGSRGWQQLGGHFEKAVVQHVKIQVLEAYW